MTLLIIGRTGQLGQALRTRRSDALALGRDTIDLSQDVSVLRANLDALTDIDGVIIAAAYTAVDAAETDTDKATRVNSVAPGVIGAWAAARNIPVVHVSTDYVFDGQGKDPHQPHDTVRPINAYGHSKAAGELSLRESGACHAILRTSWVYDGLGHNFLTTMLRLAATRDTLGVVADQIGRPTFAGHLADACLIALEGLTSDPSKSGTYHISDAGHPISWAAFAKAIFAETSQSVTVNPIPASDYPTPAARPSNSVMALEAFAATFDYTAPDWRIGLSAALAQYELAQSPDRKKEETET